MNTLHTFKLLNPDRFLNHGYTSMYASPIHLNTYTLHQSVNTTRQGVIGVTLEADYQCSTKYDTKILLLFSICRVEMEVKGSVRGRFPSFLRIICNF